MTVPNGLSAVTTRTTRRSCRWFTAHGMPTIKIGTATKSTCGQQILNYCRPVIFASTALFRGAEA